MRKGAPKLRESKVHSGCEKRIKSVNLRLPANHRREENINFAHNLTAVCLGLLMTSLCKAISPRSLRFSNYKARFPPKIGRRRVQTRCRRLRAALKRIHLDIASTFDSLSLCLRGPPYMTSAQKLRGVKKCSKFVDKHYKFCGQ